MTKKRNGFTTVELIVSFILVSIIVFFLFELIFIIKDIYTNSGIKTKLLSKQALLSEKINYDFRTKELSIANKCGETCLELYFSDGKSKVLSYDRKAGILSYGTYKEFLVDGSKFGNIVITAEASKYPLTNQELNGILTIKVPIYNTFLPEEDFGLNIVYQYNSMKTAISTSIVDTVDATKKVFLIGPAEDIAFEGIPYTDPGYYLFDVKTSTTSNNDPSVVVTGEIGNVVGESYYKHYKYYSMNGSIMAEVTRKVTVIKSLYTFNYKGVPEEINIPVKGVYKVETWGASGGGTTSMKGLGGYTSANVNLNLNDKLRIFVGGEGTTGTSNIAAPGGFNGGGDSGGSALNYASSGGGSTDVRLNNDNLSSRLVVAGGGGGGGCRNDSSFTCFGGIGGGASGGIGECSSPTYLGGAGTSTVGGDAASYTTNCTKVATKGASLTGGNGATYVSGSTSYSGGGGGGGYFGGGGGSRYGGGGGGSGYCAASVSSCTQTSGNTTMPTPSGKGYEKGHNGNGFIKITLISVTS
ncbi:MAG: glycine rich domain-containing protein [Bacilli bacterium]